MADYRRLPGLVPARWQWHEQAACQGLQITLFFHPDAERGALRRRRDATAKAICRCCPVLAQCREHALGEHESYGVWGGLSEEERENLLRERGQAGSVVPAAARGTNAH